MPINALPTKARLPTMADRLALRWSTSRIIDGLWVGHYRDAAAPALQRVEEALSTIKRYDPLQHARVIHNLDRIWVYLIPDAIAYFDRSISACVLDERFVLAVTTTPNEIASAIIHEATHAKLECRGVNYEEGCRSRIESICLRRELAFAVKLPHGEQLREQIVRTLAACADPAYFTTCSSVILKVWSRSFNTWAGRLGSLEYL